jgi:hypothetical protein
VIAGCTPANEKPLPGMAWEGLRSGLGGSDTRPVVEGKTTGRIFADGLFLRCSIKHTTRDSDDGSTCLELSGTPVLIVQPAPSCTDSASYPGASE